MSATLWLLTAALAVTGPNAKDKPGDARIQGCLVTLIREAEVSAEEAGVLVEQDDLTELNDLVGRQVQKGAYLAQINDSKVRVAKKVAVAEHMVAQAQAVNDINVRYAQKASSVSEYEYRMHTEANKKTKGTTPMTELKKLFLTYQKAELQIEQAQLEQDVAKLTADAKQAAVEATDVDIERRRIVAPISGMVVEVFQHVGEWVNPGDPVLRIIQMDRLRVEGFVIAAEFSPDEIDNRSVVVRVKLARGRVEEFQGEVVAVDPRVDGGVRYKVWAEVVNREENGHWLLRPGHEAEMVIQTHLAKRPMAAR